MAKIKVPKVKDLSGYFFMSIEGNIVDIVYHDNTENGLAIGAAFASALEKDSSKKKPNPKQMNGVKSDAPFVKTRKTTKK